MLNMNLQILRKTHKFTQEEVAEIIHVSRQAVAKWENGESLPDVNNCIALAELYNVSLDTLVSGDGAEGLPLPPKGKHVFGTVTVGERGQIVIPKKAREIFHIKFGDSLMVLGDENQGGLALIDADKLLGSFEMMKKSAKQSEKEEHEKESED